MGYCRICAWLTRRRRGEIQDAALRQVHARGPGESFLQVAPRLTGRVLELGSGTGLLFEHYVASAWVIGLEPDADFLPDAREAAQRARANVQLVRGNGESLPFADAAFDAGVVSLVLCSVDRPERALLELLRVVRPGGLLYFYEHVVSRRWAYRTFQHLTAPVVAWLAEGCHWNRDTGALIRRLPIEIESEEHLTLPAPPLPALPIVRIVARKHG